MSRHTVRLTQTGRLCRLGTPKVYHRIYAVTQTISQPVLAPCAGTEALRLSEAGAGPAPPSVRVNCPLLRTDTFFFCAVMGGGCRAAAVWAPTSSQLARVPRCATRPTASDPPASHVLPAARAGAALCKCGVAVQPGHGGQH